MKYNLFTKDKIEYIDHIFTYNKNYVNCDKSINKNKFINTPYFTQTIEKNEIDNKIKYILAIGKNRRYYNHFIEACNKLKILLVIADTNIDKIKEIYYKN